MGLLVGGFILSIVSTAIEVKLLHNPKLRRFGEWVSRSSMRSMAVSICISYVIGTVFGATGVLMAVSAMFATLISYPVHRVIVANRRKDTDLYRRIKVVETKARMGWNTWKWAFTGLKYALLVLTAPFWVPVYIHQRWIEGNRPWPIRSSSSGYSSARSSTT